MKDIEILDVIENRSISCKVSTFLYFDYRLGGVGTLSVQDVPGTCGKKHEGRSGFSKGSFSI